jgi:hypothetical protein
VYESGFCHCDKILEKNSLRKDLFGLRVTVHGQLAPLLLGTWQGRSIMEDSDGGGKLLTSWYPEERE